MEHMDVSKLTDKFEELCQEIRPLFKRKESHEHTCNYLYGLLHSPLWTQLLDIGKRLKKIPLTVCSGF